MSTPPFQPSKNTEFSLSVPQYQESLWRFYDHPVENAFYGVLTDRPRSQYAAPYLSGQYGDLYQAPWPITMQNTMPTSANGCLCNVNRPSCASPWGSRNYSYPTMQWNEKGIANLNKN
jgi:hypothetical protein